MFALRFGRAVIRTYVIVCPEVPKSINAGGAGSRVHWSVAAREKKHFEELLLWELQAARVSRGMKFCKVSVTVRWKTRKRRDPVNWAASISKPLDALVKFGYLPDDDERHFEFVGPRFEYPEAWPYRDPRVKADMVLVLECVY